MRHDQRAPTSLARPGADIHPRDPSIVPSDQPHFAGIKSPMVFSTVD
jgi:hypothetical protein